MQTTDKIFNPETWNTGKIQYSDRSVEVRYLPGANEKIAMDERGYLYFHDTTRRVWRRYGHGIYWLYRGIMGMLLTHKYELPEMQEVERECSALKIDFKLLPLGGSYVELKARETLFGILMKLDRAIDERKVEALGQLILCVPLRDSRGRRNVGVLLCRDVTAIAAIERRIKAIESIGPWLQFYRHVVKGWILRMEQCLRTLNRTLSELLENIDVIMRRGEDQFSLKALNLRLAETATQIEDLGAIKPYSHIHAHLRAERIAVHQMLDAKEYVDAAVLVSRMWNSTLICHGRSVMEKEQCYVSMVARRKSLLDDWYMDMIRRIGKIAETCLERADDSGFRMPVREDMLSRLRQANKLLEGELKSVDVKQAKKILDKAIQPG